MYVAQSTVRQEVRRGTSGPVRVWLDSEVAAATYRVLDPRGEQRQGSQSAAVVQLGVPARTRLDCTVPTSLELGLGYELEVTVGATVEHLPFDVVLRPLGRRPSLDDILRVRTQAGAAIEAQAHRLGVSPEHYVTDTLGDRARGRLEGMIRAQLPRDSRVTEARPYAILDTDRLHRVEILLAVAALYESTMTGAEDGDSAGALRSLYLQEAEAEMRAMGPIRIDTDGDGVADRADEASGASIMMQRVQG